MPGGQHRFEFVGTEPLAVWIVVSLIFANTLLMSLLEFGSRYVLPERVPQIVYWYGDRSIAIQFILLAVLAAIFIIFRKRVRYFRRK